MTRQPVPGKHEPSTPAGLNCWPCREGEFFASPHDSVIGHALVRYGEYSPDEVRLLTTLCQPGDTVVEAGAYIGALSVPLARRLGPSGRLHCFEPQPDACQVLVANLARNGLAQVTVHAAGLGATPVNISLTEVYEALQRGLVDCTFGQFVWLDDYSLAEQAKYLLTPNAGVVPAQLWVGINKDSWNKLSVEDRQVLFDATPAAVARVTFNYDSGAKAAIEHAVANGVVYNAPEEWLTSAVAAATTTVRDDAVARAEESGVVNAAAIADRFLAIYAEWEDKVKDIETQEQFAQLLADEIYSKVDVTQ